MNLSKHRLSTLVVFIFSPLLLFGNWNAEPITVHEWGVNTFDWNDSKRLNQEFPAFLHTDNNPGLSVPKPGKRVRDMDPDSGIRTKPVLYFYPGKRWGRLRHRFNTEEFTTSVGVEMRFAYGNAFAWWPQVNTYRTPEIAARAQAPDWESWQAEKLEKLKQDPQRLKEYHSLEPEDQIAFLANRMGSRFRRKGEKFPEDQRMELVWDSLKLSPKMPKDLSLPGTDLPDNHWVKIAREVDAHYVSMGGEVERYLFYEGKTRESPAIALLPTRNAVDSFPFPWNHGEDPLKEVAVVNISEHPIYDVIAVYRNTKKGILWTGHIAMLPALSTRIHHVDQTIAMRIPDFENPRPEDNLKMGAPEFERRTKFRLIENLTGGIHLDPGGVSPRDPADKQPPTTSHYLYTKEAIGLEKIWHDDFFETEGFTIVYRESPGYLDEAMPLHIYTDMFWYVKLSRCGLVLNRNLPIQEVHEVNSALKSVMIAHWNPQHKDLREHAGKAEPILKKNKFLTLGQNQFINGRKVQTYSAEIDQK